MRRISLEWKLRKEVKDLSQKAWEPDPKTETQVFEEKAVAEDPGSASTDDRTGTDCQDGEKEIPTAEAKKPPRSIPTGSCEGKKR